MVKKLFEKVQSEFNDRKTRREEHKENREEAWGEYQGRDDTKWSEDRWKANYDRLNAGDLAHSLEQRTFGELGEAASEKWSSFREGASSMYEGLSGKVNQMREKRNFKKKRKEAWNEYQEKEDSAEWSKERWHNTYNGRHSNGVENADRHLGHDIADGARSLRDRINSLGEKANQKAGEAGKTVMSRSFVENLEAASEKWSSFSEGASSMYEGLSGKIGQMRENAKAKKKFKQDRKNAWEKYQAKDDSAGWSKERWHNTYSGRHSNGVENADRHLGQVAVDVAKEQGSKAAQKAGEAGKTVMSRSFVENLEAAENFIVKTAMDPNTYRKAIRATAITAVVATAGPLAAAGTFVAGYGIQQGGEALAGQVGAEYSAAVLGTTGTLADIARGDVIGAGLNATFAGSTATAGYLKSKGDVEKAQKFSRAGTIAAGARGLWGVGGLVADAVGIGSPDLEAVVLEETTSPEDGRVYQPDPTESTPDVVLPEDYVAPEPPTVEELGDMLPPRDQPDVPPVDIPPADYTARITDVADVPKEFGYEMTTATPGEYSSGTILMDRSDGSIDVYANSELEGAIGDGKFALVKFDDNTTQVYDMSNGSLRLEDASNIKEISIGAVEQDVVGGQPVETNFVSYSSVVLDN